MAELEKHYSLPLDQDEMHYLVHCLNMSRAIIVGDIKEQFECGVIMTAFLYKTADRVDKMNGLRMKIAKMIFGEEKTEQMLKDIESEASAKGYKRCPDCGGFHA